MEHNGHCPDNDWTWSTIEGCIYYDDRGNENNSKNVLEMNLDPSIPVCDGSGGCSIHAIKVKSDNPRKGAQLDLDNNR